MAGSSGSKQLTRYGIEATVGTVATEWQTLAFTTNSLDEKPKTAESATIKDSRIASGTLVTGSEIAGDIDTEFAFGIQDTLLECVAYNPWVNDVLTFGGSVEKSLSVLKAYTDKSLFYTFTGCHVNTWKLSVPEDGIVTSTFTIMGMNRTPSSVAPAGNITPAPNAVQFTTLSAGDVKFNNAPITACATKLDVTFDNTAQVQKCISFDDNIHGIIATMMQISGTVTLAWEESSALMYENQFSNNTVALSWTLQDSIGNKYILNFPKVLLSAPMPSGGSGDLLSTDFTFTVKDVAPTLTRVPA